jgi:integrase
MEVIIKLAAFYGLRRSEVLGLKWKAINFNDDTLFITHSVGIVIVDGAYAMCSRDKLKRTSSFRTLPLTPVIKELLLRLQRNDMKIKRPNLKTYICIDKKGQLIKTQLHIKVIFSDIEKAWAETYTFSRFFVTDAPVF